MNKMTKEQALEALDRLWSETFGNNETSSMSNRSDRDLIKQYITQQSTSQEIEVEKLLKEMQDNVHTNLVRFSKKWKLVKHSLQTPRITSEQTTKLMKLIDWHPSDERWDEFHNILHTKE